MHLKPKFIRSKFRTRLLTNDSSEAPSEITRKLKDSSEDNKSGELPSAFRLASPQPIIAPRGWINSINNIGLKLSPPPMVLSNYKINRRKVKRVVSNRA